MRPRLACSGVRDLLLAFSVGGGSFSSHATSRTRIGLQPLKKALPFFRFLLQCSGRGLSRAVFSCHCRGTAQPCPRRASFGFLAFDSGCLAAPDRRGLLGFPLEGLTRNDARARKSVILRASDENARRTPTHLWQPPIVQSTASPCRNSRFLCHPDRSDTAFSCTRFLYVTDYFTRWLLLILDTAIHKRFNRTHPSGRGQV